MRIIKPVKTCICSYLYKNVRHFVVFLQHGHNNISGGLTFEQPHDILALLLLKDI